MPISRARQIKLNIRRARTGYCCSLAALLVMLGSESLQTAVAEGDTRTISLHHIHTDEDLTITYKRDGRYDEAALKKIDWELRDWRRGESIHMDPQLIDLVWQVTREIDSKQPVWVVCGYRAPETNAMLRRRSSGVAEFSQHTLGKAMDFYLPGASLEQLRVIGLRMQRGGVGFYPTSGSPFVHLDVGSVRYWPRMNREQLARVFPDGRTVYLPSDGKPLAGYALALADIEKRGTSNPSALSLNTARMAGLVKGDTATSGSGPRNIIQALFSGANKDEDEDQTAATSVMRSGARPSASKPSGMQLASATDDMTLDKPAAIRMPLPPPRPVAFKTAAANDRVASAGKLSGATLASANDVIQSRGYWESQPELEAQISAAARRLGRSNGGDDRAPAELTLAYAGPADVSDVARPAPMGTKTARAVTTAAIDPSLTAKRDVTGRRAPGPMQPAKIGDRTDNPWLRAMVIAPNARDFMNTSLLGAANTAVLSPMMRKPASSVMMTFSNDPYLGMTDDRFSGEAVVFVSTVTFVSRTTASLQN